MTSTTHGEFDKNTDGLLVAKSFPEAIKDRIILITGVNKLGIGYGIAEAFASQKPALLILAGRSDVKLQDCVVALSQQYPSVKLRKLIVDLGSMKSVQTAAEEVLGWEDAPSIDIVVNNAGIMRHGIKHEKSMPVSADGIEDMFAINHLGHFLLTNLIMSKIIAAAEDKPAGAVRIVNVSSSGTWVSPFRASDVEWKRPMRELPEKERPNFKMLKMAGMDIDEDGDDTYMPSIAYGASKTCNVLFSGGLNRRLFEKYGVLSIAINPGEIKSELSRNTDRAVLDEMIAKYEKSGRLHWKTPGQGAATSLVAACDPQLGLPAAGGSGIFMGDCQIALAPPYAVAEEPIEKLWGISESLAGQVFRY